jgi:sirohydrochlorin ferrochelatase
MTNDKPSAPTSQRTAILLAGHGSRLCGAGKVLHQHAARLRDRWPDTPVAVGFLNHGKPTFEELFHELSQINDRLVVLPYTLATGRSTHTDLLRRISDIQQPGQCATTVAAPLGHSPQMVQAIIEMIATARPPRLWRNDLFDPSSCENRPDCPLFRHPCPHAEDGVPDPSTPESPDRSTEACLPEVAQTALLLIAHGTAKPQREDFFARTLGELRTATSCSWIREAYLTNQEPAIGDAVQQCAAAGAKRVVAIPCFLLGGIHVARDVPEQLCSAAAALPGVEILMTSFVGRSAFISEILALRAEEAIAGL